MSVRLPSGVLAQFATNVELIDNASTTDGVWRPSGYRYALDKEPDSGMHGKYFISLQAIVDRDPKWGTGENIQHGRVTVRTSYFRGGGDAGGGDIQSVMRDAADDCQIIGDVLENPENYNSIVTGIRQVRCRGSAKVVDKPHGEIWETTFDVEWRSDLATTPVIVPSGDGGVTLLPLAGEFASEGVADQEDVASQSLTVNFDDFTSFETVKVRLLGFAKTAGGTATFRVRLGGTKGAADGTEVASMTTTSASYDLATGIGSAFTLPSGLQMLQVTLECDGAYVCTLDGVGVAILDGAS